MISMILILHPRFFTFFNISSFEIQSIISIFLSQKIVFSGENTLKISAIESLNSLPSSNANIFFELYFIILSFFQV